MNLIEIVTDEKDAKSTNFVVVDTSTFAICAALNEIVKALRERR
jgi:hypothetical protein